jgi:hypothetical protein
LTTSHGAANEIDVTDLAFQEKQKLLERLVKVAEEDNERFLLKVKERVDRYIVKSTFSCLIALFTLCLDKQLN